jgi:CRISPR-associated protein Csb1
MSELSKFDDWFGDKGPAALVIREHLIPVEGADGVFFPATYAAQQGADKDREKFQGGYNLDIFPDGTNVCLVDSVGSQANRIEPLFATSEYADLVPQIVVTFPEKGLRLNLLHANHRAADAIIRCSPFEQELRTAFQEVLRGNAEKLAQFAPTSLVFGVWDSRDTSAKVPRLLASTIRAFNVRGHTRSANFLTQMTIDLAKLGILPGAESKDGFANALASRAPGGIQLMPNGSIRRDATVGLAALRRLAVLEADGTLSVDRTKALRRYILGLTLVALTAPQDSYLRQGCNLVPDCDKPREFKVVNLDGTRPDASISHEEAVKYVRAALKEFRIGKDREERFDATLAEKAGEAKPEKVKGEVISVDVDGKKFKLRVGRGKEIEITATNTTAITKGKDATTFEAAVTVGATLKLDVMSGVAVTITGKK